MSHEESPDGAAFEEREKVSRNRSPPYAEEDDAEASWSSSYATATDTEASTTGEGEEAQESLLSFTAFPLSGLQEHHIMTVRAFSNFVAIGTNQGAIFLTAADNSSGDRDSSGSILHCFYNHSNPISDIGGNITESFLVSCDKTGVVAVQSVNGSVKDVWSKQLDTPVQSVALHPQYHTKDDEPVVCGGGRKVVLLTKTFLWGHRRVTVLGERYAKVLAVRWSGEVIAWLTDRGIHLFSYTDRALLRVIPRPLDVQQPELYPCTLLWETEYSLLCGWGDWIEALTVTPVAAPGRHSSAVAGEPSRSHRVTQRGGALRTSRAGSPYRVGGLAPFGDHRYLVLACVVDEEGAMRDLEVRVVLRDSLEDVYRGRLLVPYMHPLQLGLTCAVGRSCGAQAGLPQGGEQGQLNTVTALGSSYESSGSRAGAERQERTAEAAPVETVAHHQGYPPEGTCYYLVSADTIVKATAADADDHVTFLLDTAQYEEAYRYALQHPLRRYQAKDIGRQLLESHLAQGELALVCSRLPLMVGTDFAEWERWIFMFDQRGESWRLVDVLPTSRAGESSVADTKCLAAGELPAAPPEASISLFIRREYYDLVVLRCLEHDPVRLNTAVHRFVGLYNTDVIAKAVAARYFGSGGSYAADTTNPHNYTAEQRRALGEAHGFLLHAQHRHAEALQVLLAVDRSDELFQLVREESLLDKVLQILPELFTRNAAKTIALLLEHIPPPSDAQRVPSPSRDRRLRSGVNASVSASRPALIAGGGAADSLAPESVIRRLESCERGDLWSYVRALQGRNRQVFVSMAKKKAQLFATLFIDYDPSGLLPFLREMSMYLDKMREIYALCRKNNLLEEMVFLMARMGKEEEGLRIIAQEMHNMRKAVEFISELSSKEDQAMLFRRLVQLAMESNSSLLSDGDEEYYFLHTTQKGDTYARLAELYDVDEAALRRANSQHELSAGASPSAPDERPPFPTCKVPANFISSLLMATADPQYAENPAFDAHYLISMLPQDLPLPHAGMCIAAVTRSRADETAFLATVAEVAERDLARYYRELMTRRAAPMRVDPVATHCAFCQQALGREAVVFGCHHAYHPSCLLTYMDADGSLNTPAARVDVSSFLAHPSRYMHGDARQSTPHCRLCQQSVMSLHQ